MFSHNEYGAMSAQHLTLSYESFCVVTIHEGGNLNISKSNLCSFVNERH